VQVSTDTLAPKDVGEVNKALSDKFGLSDNPNVESIGPPSANLSPTPR
jgi:hypothetical protein